MSQLDQIRKKQLIESPETINADWNSPSTSLDDRAGAFSLALKYENGVGPVSMVVTLQLSVDDINFADVTDSEITITDTEGVAIYDVDGSGTSYARLKVTVTSGSIDAVELKYVASQFH